MTADRTSSGEFEDLDTLLGLTRSKPQPAVDEQGGEKASAESSPAAGAVGGSPSTAEAPSLAAALQAIEARAVAAPRESTTPDQGPEQLLIRFEAAGTAFAVPMRQVLEISDRLPLTRVPGLPAHFPGISNLRGEIVLVLDLPALLTGHKSADANRILLLHRDGETVGAVAMERILGIAPYDQGSFRRAGSQIRHGLVQHEMGLIEFAGRSYSVVDLVGLLEGPLPGLPQGGVG